MPNFPLQLTRSNSQAKVRVRVPDALLLSCSFSSFISVDFIVIYGAATRSDKFSKIGWRRHIFSIDAEVGHRDSMFFFLKL